tara:strand:+ start:3929 stop:4738 length:810 start_codon:yes stop_codon:yes gene_type:complete
MGYKTTQNTPYLGDSSAQKYTGTGMLARPNGITPQVQKPQAQQPMIPIPQSAYPVQGKSDIDIGTAFGESTNTGTSANTGMSPTALASINAAGNNLQTGMASGNYAGMGAGVGGAVGSAFGPAGGAIGGAVGAVGGGLVDMFLADAEKEKMEKKAKAEEKKKKKWQEYSLSLEERGRNVEDEKLQYARDDISQQRMLGAQQEMLKTKNAILQSGNMYRSRMGRNWYGPQGLTATTRGGGVASGTTARDLGYQGNTAESTRIKKPLGMGY